MSYLLLGQLGTRQYFQKVSGREIAQSTEEGHKNEVVHTNIRLRLSWPEEIPELSRLPVCSCSKIRIYYRSDFQTAISNGKLPWPLEVFRPTQTQRALLGKLGTRQYFQKVPG